jgi:hypothetical protein
VLVDFIEHCGVDEFYVGREGAFDAAVYEILKEVAGIYPHIRYTVVLAYMPSKQGSFAGDCPDTLLPQGIENVHPRFAIAWRNRWMLGKADYVVAYIIYSWGGAAEFARMAVRQKKKVIHIAVGG